MTLADYQFQIGALVMGPTTPYIIQRTAKTNAGGVGFTGFGIPDVRSSDLPRPLDHGDYFGRDFIAARIVAIPITVLGVSPADVLANVDALLAEWQVDTPDSTTTKPLSFKFPGKIVQRLNGRPRRAAFESSTAVNNNIEGVLEYTAADPRIYDDALTSTTVALPGLTGGRTYNLVFPRVFGAVASSGIINVVNAGNFPTRPIATILGPVDNPRLENVTTGTFMQFNISLAAGDTLVVDFDQRTIVYNGSSRYFTRSNDSTWWQLAAGTTQVNFRGTYTGAGSQMTLAVRSAWL